MQSGIIYTRVSSEEQVKGTSLDFQEEQCRNYCEQKGIQILGVFREEGASAKTAVRAEFLRAIEFCRKNKGKVNVFVVAKVDRFSRRTEDHFMVRKMLMDYGVQLHSVTEPIGGDNPMEKLFETMLAGFSDFDNAIRRQRCMDGMSEKINKGIFPWQPPLGYKCANTKKQGLKKLDPDPPDEHVFPLIQRALVEFSKGNYSKTELAQQLDSWGLAEKRGGKRTYVQFVDHMVSPKRLKFYAGILENPWTGMDVKGLHVPMIDERTRHEILYILSGKKPRPKLAHNTNFPLRGSVHCDSCDQLLTGSTSRGNGGSYHYYHCKNKVCDRYGKAVRKVDLETLYTEYLKRITPTQNFLKVFKESVIDYWKEQGQTLSESARAYQKQIQTLELRRKRIFDMRECGEYSQEEFIERKEGIDTQIATLKIAFGETQIEQLDLEVAVSYATQFIADLSQQWFDLPDPVRPRFQQLVFPNGFTPKQLQGVGTLKLGCIFELSQLNAVEVSSVVPSPGIEPGSLP